MIRLLDALTLERGKWALAVAAVQIVAGIVLVASSTSVSPRWRC